MSDRGVYRGVYSTMVDDPDYQALSPAARHVLLTLRICPQNNAASLFRIYPSVLQAQTGYGPAKAERALAELEACHWILRDGTLLWIRNGLRYDPNMRLSDGKHLKSVAKAIAPYSKSTLWRKFCEYYEIACPSGDHAKTLPRPIEDPSQVFSPRPNPRPRRNPSPSSTPSEGHSAPTVGQDPDPEVQEAYARLIAKIGGPK